MARALLVVGLLLVFAGALPTWGDEDYFEIKRVHTFDIGLVDPLVETREWLVPDRSSGGWTRIARAVDVTLVGWSAASLVAGALLLGLRFYFQRKTSNTVCGGEPTS
jgi:hypothetical protein